MAAAHPDTIDVEQLNDAFAREHDIDDYYHKSSCLIRFIERQRLQVIRQMARATENDHILEVGCGGGHVLQLFPTAQLTGVDVSGEMLAKARRNLRTYQVTLLKGQLHQLDLPEASFDTIICTEVLEHTVSPAAVLDHIRRLVRPSGRVVITFPNDYLVNRLKTLIRKSGLTRLPPFRRLSWGGDHYHFHTWSIPEMRRLLERYFTVRQIRFAPCGVLPIRCCFLCDPRP